MMEWTREILHDLMSQLTQVCDMLPASELLRDLQSQLKNINNYHIPANRTCKDVLLDHLVGILQDIMSQTKGIILLSEMFQNHIVNQLIGITMVLLSMSENTCKMAPINGKVKDILSRLLKSFWGFIQTEWNKSEKMKASISNDLCDLGIFERNRPAYHIDSQCEITNSMDLVFTVFNDLTQHLRNMYLMEWEMLKESGSYKMPILNEDILDHLLAIMKNMLSEVIEINLVERIPKNYLLIFFIAVLQHLTSLVLDEVFETEDELYKPLARNYLIGTINALLSLLVNISEVTGMKGKLEEMLLRLVYETSMKPVIEIPQKIWSVLEMDPESVPINIIENVLVFLHSLINFEEHPPVLWLPRNLLVFFQSLPFKAPVLQKYLELQILRILHQVPKHPNGQMLEVVGVLQVHLGTMLHTVKKTHPFYFIDEKLDFLCSLLQDIMCCGCEDGCSSTEKSDKIAQNTHNIMLEILTNFRRLKSKILDNIFSLIQDRVSQIMERYFVGVRPDYVVGVIPKNLVMDFLIQILQQVTSETLDEHNIGRLQCSEARNVLIVIIRVLLLALAEKSELALITGKLKDLLTQLLNISTLNPVPVIPQNLRLLLEIEPENVPIELVMYHLDDISEYLQSLDDFVAWIPRNLLLLFMNITKLLHWGKQNKPFSYFRTLLDPVSERSNTQTVNPVVCVIYVDTMLLQEYVEKLTQIQNIKSLGSAQNVTADILPQANILYIEWTSRNLKDWLFQILCVCNMCEHELIQDLQIQISTILNWIEALNDRSIPNNVILDHIVSILQDLLSIFTEFNWGDSETKTNQILDFLYGLTKVLLSLSNNVSETPPVNLLLNEMLSFLSQRTNILVSSKTYKDLLLELTHVCNSVPENNLIKDVKSQITNMSLENSASRIPQDVMLKKLVSILEDLLLQVIQLNSSGELHREQILHIRVSLYGLIKDLLSISLNISKSDPISRTLKDMLSSTVEISIFNRIHDVNETKHNVEVVNKLLIDMQSELKEMTMKEWESERIMALIETSTIKPNTEVCSNLQFHVLNVIRKIKDKLSKSPGFKWVKEIPDNKILESFVEILQHLVSVVIGQPEYHSLSIIEPLIGTIKTLMLVDISEKALVYGRLKELLSQLLNISSLNPVVGIPEKLRLLLEIEPENVPKELAIEYFSDMKEYLKSLCTPSTGPIVWVPRNLLVICVNSLMVLCKGLHDILQIHLKKILDPTTGIPNDREKVLVSVLHVDQTLVSVLHVDLIPLIHVMELLITLPPSKRKSDICFFHVNNQNIDELSKIIKISKMKCTGKRLKDLLTELVGLCNLFSEYSFKMKKISYKLLYLYQIIPASGIIKEEIQYFLVTILQDMTSYVTRVDSAWRMHQNTVETLIQFPSVIQNYCKVFQNPIEPISSKQILDDLSGIIKSLQSLFDNASGIASVNGKLKDMLTDLNKSKEGKTTKDTLDPDREAIRDYGIQLIRECKILPENVVPKNLLLQIKYLCGLDHAIRIPKLVILDRLVSIHQDLSESLGNSMTFAKMELNDLKTGLMSRVNIQDKTPVTDLVSQFVNKLKLVPQNELLKEMQSNITNTLNLCKIDIAKISTYKTLGIFVFMIKPLSLNVDGITKGMMEHHLSKIGKNLMSLLQNLHLVGRMPKKKNRPRPYSEIPELPQLGEIMADAYSFLDNEFKKRQTEVFENDLDILSDPLYYERLNETFENLEEIVTSNLQEIDRLCSIPKNILSNITDEPSTEWMIEAVKYLATWFIKLQNMLSKNEFLKNLKLQLINISRINTAGGISEDVILDHLVGILQDLLLHVIDDRNINGITRDQMLDDLTDITMGLLSLSGNKPRKPQIYERLKEVVSRINAFRMDIQSKALNNQILLKLQVLSKKYEELKQSGPENEIYQDQTLDHLLLIFKYLVPVLLNRSGLNDINETLECLQSRIVNISRTDPVSGLPKDLLSLLVYGFFPASHMYFHKLTQSHQLVPQYILKENDATVIYTGSVPEGMYVPFIKETEKSLLLFSDIDKMVVTGDFGDETSFLIDDTEAVFGILYDTVPQEKNKHLVYSSAAANYILRRDQTLIRRPQHSSYSNDYDSPSMLFKSFDPYRIADTDLLFCVPVNWREDFKQNFLRRLKANEWPMNSVPDLDKLLTEYVYAVPKPDPYSADGDFRWRLSFSVVEVELARSLSDIQRRCYRVLKTLIKFVVNKDLPEHMSFPSYYLKTAMFWFCESNPQKSWKIHSLGIQWLKLIDSVIESLEKKKLLMYFVPTYNLLNEKDGPTVRVWKERMQKIREEPLKAFSKISSAYETGNIHLRFDHWQTGFYNFLYSLTEIGKSIFEYDQPNYKESIYTCHWVIIKFLLATYSLEDFLNYVKIYPQTNKIILREKAESKEHLIWMYYNTFVVYGIPHQEVPQSDTYSKYWSYLAEVTHHMVLKYADKVPNKDLFSSKTAERFYLIACCIQNSKGTCISETYLKYVNYLFAEKRPEEAVHTLIKVYQRLCMLHNCIFSRVTSEVLDTCLKLRVAFQIDDYNGSSETANYLLTSCYMQDGVLAEVCLISSLEWKIQLGFQYIICGQLYEAFKTFASIDECGLIVLCYNVKYAAMLFLIARISNQT